MILFLFLNLFIFIAGWGFHCGLRAFSSCRQQRLLFVVVRRLLMAVASLVAELWCTGLVAPQHVGSSWTRDQTCVPCIGRRILNPWPTRELPFKERSFLYVWCWLYSVIAQFSDNVQGPSLQSWGCHIENGKYRGRLVVRCIEIFPHMLFVNILSDFILRILSYVPKNRMKSIVNTHNSPFPFNSC